MHVTKPIRCSDHAQVEQNLTSTGKKDQALADYRLSFASSYRREEAVG